ncbi:MAG: hypothetical protein OXH61_04285 [Acidimicrobiaceae bacterium]|nr:hypothetical protein [Acidimicrobiaceae bacterium]
MNFNFGADILYQVLINFTLIGVLGWYIRKRIAARIDLRNTEQIERFRANLQLENETALAELKDNLEEAAFLHASAHRSFAVAQEAAMERRLQCAESLWNELLRFRNSLPPILSFVDILTEQEYHNILETPDGPERFRDLSMDSITELAGIDGSGSIEGVRPFIDDYLWRLFVRYRVIQARILVHLVWLKERGTDIYWYHHSYTRQLIADALSTDELKDLDRLNIGKIEYIRESIELKILEELRRMISGESSSSESLKEARRLQSLSRDDLFGTHNEN